MVISGQTFGNVNISTKKKKNWLLLISSFQHNLLGDCFSYGVNFHLPQLSQVHKRRRRFTLYQLLYHFLFSQHRLDTKSDSFSAVSGLLGEVNYPTDEPIQTVFERELIFSTCFEILLKIGELIAVCQYNRLMAIFQCNFQTKMWIVLSFVNKRPTAIK